MKAQQHNRSQQLSPLSKEHNDGTVFIARVRQGLDKIAFERLRAYTLWYWKNHIRPHFFQEEKILLPYIPQDHPWGVKLKEDHAYIRSLILSLDERADKHCFTILCDLIDTHVRFEERDLFSYLEEHLSESELNTIATRLEHHPVDAEEWNDPFWN